MTGRLHPGRRPAPLKSRVKRPPGCSSAGEGRAARRADDAAQGVGGRVGAAHVDRRDLEREIASGNRPFPRASLRRQFASPGVEQDQARGVKGPRIGEHLIDVRWRDAERFLARGETLPLGIEHDGPLRRFDRRVGPQREEGTVRAGQRVMAGGLQADGTGRKGASQALPDEPLEEFVHREEQRETRRTVARRALPLAGEEEARQRVEGVEGGVGPVEPHQLAQGMGRIAHGFEAGGEFRQQPGVGLGEDDAPEPRHRRLEETVQRRVPGEFVEPAGEAVRPSGEMRDLARDVELPAQQPQIVFPRDVTAGQAAPHGGQQPLGEQPDNQFQQVAPLRGERRERAVGHGEVVRHGEHVDQRPGHGVVLALDLGQDFDGPPRNREDSDDLPRLQPLVGAGQDIALGKLQSPRRALGEGMEPRGFRLGQAALADRQGLPLPEGERLGRRLMPLRVPHPRAGRKSDGRRRRS